MSRDRDRGERLRVPLAGLQAGVLELPADAARYVARVHRLRCGDRFVAFDPTEALEAEAELLAGPPDGAGAKGAGIWVRLGEPQDSSLCPTRRVTLLQALGKGSKLDGIVRDATELGATVLVPALAERSIKRPKKPGAQLERWRRVAVEAARQCGRGEVPQIEEIAPLLDAMSQHGPDRAGALGLCLHPNGAVQLRDALAELGPDQGVTVVVGPEGGLTPAELEHAQRCGYRSVRLGDFVLRTETVCAAVLGAIAALA